MKSIITPSVLALTLLATGSAMAADPYAGASMLFVDATVDPIDEDASLMGFTGLLGSAINENISGEVRVTLGVDDDTVGEGILRTKLELNSMIGAYLRAGIPMGPNFTPYAVLGFTRAELDASNPYFDIDTDSDTDVSYGIGMDLSLDRKLSLNVEYMNYYDKDDSEISGFSIGIASKI